MCGRAVRTSPAEVLRDLLALRELPLDLPRRYNLAPTQPIPVVRQPGKLELLRWGLTLANPRAGGFNARAESLRSGTYRKTKRCLVVVDGFYEWKRMGRTRQPYLVFRADRDPLVLAGVYDATEGCAIVTAPSRGIVAKVHDRMPVVLERDAFAAWLDPDQDVRSILASASADSLAAYPVNPRVGSVRNDDASLVEPVPEMPEGGTRDLF